MGTRVQFGKVIKSPGYRSVRQARVGGGARLVVKCRLRVKFQLSPSPDCEGVPSASKVTNHR